MKSATTFLMFQGQANEAIHQYQQWFSDLEIKSLTYMENSQDSNGYTRFKKSENYGQ